MRRGRPPAQPHIPDPSATIPDFGPRSDVDQAKLEEIRKLIPPPTDEKPAPAPQPKAQREPATPSGPAPSTVPTLAPISKAAKASAAPASKGRSPWLLIGVVLLLAVLAAGAGFFLAIGFGVLTALVMTL